MRNIHRMTFLTDSETTMNIARQMALCRILSGVGHEMSNKLAAILGYSELALMTMEGGRQETMDMLSIRDAAQRCGDITNSLMELTPKNNGNGKAPFEAGSAIGEVVGLLEKSFQSKNIKISREFPRAPVVVNASKGEFMVMALLLLLKLVEGAGRGSRICVRLERLEDGTAEIEMSFSGGEHPELQPFKYVELLPNSIMCGDLADSVCEAAVKKIGGSFVEESDITGERRFVVMLPAAGAEMALAAV